MNWTDSDCQLANSGEEYFESWSVESALGDDHVGVPFAWFDESLVSGPNGFEVLIDDALGGTAAIGDVASEAPNEADVGRGIDEDLKVESLAQYPIPEHEDPVDHDDFLGVNGAGVTAAVVLGVVVDRHLDGRAVGECSHVVVEEWPVERVGMVIVRGATCLERLVTAVEVVRVEFDS